MIKKQIEYDNLKYNLNLLTKKKLNDTQSNNSIP